MKTVLSALFCSLLSSPLCAGLNDYCLTAADNFIGYAEPFVVDQLQFRAVAVPNSEGLWCIVSRVKLSLRDRLAAWIPGFAQEDSSVAGPHVFQYQTKSYRIQKKNPDACVEVAKHPDQYVVGGLSTRRYRKINADYAHQESTDTFCIATPSCRETDNLIGYGPTFEDHGHPFRLRTEKGNRSSLDQWCFAGDLSEVLSVSR